ncbi:MAG TPA: hypothetical protein VGJ05_14400 [Fimbriiglobus sp.]|jgi:ElaB/YqjD/DUF883 family membrane-anchored ribosome-binding protein
MDRKSPELIEAQMEETRQSLTEKVSALEDSVVGTVQSATTAVQDTVHSVRDAVEGTVETVRRQLGSAFDLRRHVQNQPWLMVAGASAAGFLTGLAFRSGRRSNTRPEPIIRPAATPSTAAIRGNGLWDSLVERFTEEMKKVGESAIQCLSAHIHRIVQDEMPGEEPNVVSAEDKPANAVSSTYPVGRWNGAVRGSRM